MKRVFPLTILSVSVTIFLLALSPLFLGSVSATTTATSLPLGNRTQHAVKTQMASSPDPQACPSKASCVYVADQAGGLQVFEGRKLLASIAILLTALDPAACPSDAYFAYGKILLTDPCGNFGNGELRVLNPSTYTWGAAVTSVGFVPTFMVLDPKNNYLYISEFDNGIVAVLNSRLQSVANITACGGEPEFLDYDQASGLVFVGSAEYNYNYDQGCIDMISGLRTLKPITQGYPGVGFIRITGVAVNQATGNVYATDAYQYGDTGLIYEFTSTGHFLRAFVPPPYTFEPWGSVYDPAIKSVLAIATFSTNQTGFALSISSNNKMIPLYGLGLAPEAGCYDPADHGVYLPNDLASVGAVVSIVTPTHHVASIDYYGFVDGFGCAAN